MGESYQYTDEAITNHGYTAGYKGRQRSYIAIAHIHDEAVKINDRVAMHRTKVWLAAFVDGWDMRKAEEAASAHVVPVTMCECGVPDVEHMEGEGCQPEWSEAVS